MFCVCWVFSWGECFTSTGPERLRSHSVCMHLLERRWETVLLHSWHRFRLWSCWGLQRRKWGWDCLKCSVCLHFSLCSIFSCFFALEKWTALTSSNEISTLQICDSKVTFISIWDSIKILFCAVAETSNGVDERNWSWPCQIPLRLSISPDFFFLF